MIVSELSDLASRLSLGPIHRFGRLAVVPLIDRTAKPSGWLTLDAALAGGEVEVTEVSESGSVPELCLLNRSSLPIFLLDGEELVGAKQNRILNLSILVPAASNFEVPVSCVEQGRWSWRSRGFQSAGRVGARGDGTQSDGNGGAVAGEAVGARGREARERRVDLGFVGDEGGEGLGVGHLAAPVRAGLVRSGDQHIALGEHDCE